MINMTFKSTGDLHYGSPKAASYEPAHSVEADAESKARRVVNAVATLRILVPVALITAIVMSGRSPETRIDSAMAPTADVPAVMNAPASSYFPAQFVNQGAGGEEHVQNF
jgi:hypothetical protein